MGSGPTSGTTDSRLLRELIVEAADALDRAERLAAAMRRKGQAVDAGDLEPIAVELPDAVFHLDALTQALGAEASPAGPDAPVPLLPVAAARAIRAARDSFDE